MRTVWSVLTRARMTHIHHILIALLSVTVSACAADGSEVPNDLDCAGEQLTMTGAVEINTPSAATFLLNQAVIGVAGFGDLGATTSYSFTLENPLSGELGTLGVHDVAVQPVRYLIAGASADCQVAGSCMGFVANAGSYEVLAVEPTYRAAFSLDALFAYDGSSTAQGAPIAGRVTGCVTAAP